MPGLNLNFIFDLRHSGVRRRNFHNLSGSNQHRNEEHPVIALTIGTEQQTPVQIPAPTNRVFTRRTRSRRPQYYPYNRLENEDTLSAPITGMDFTSVRITPPNRNGQRTRPRRTPPGPQLRLQNTNEADPQHANSSTNSIYNGENVSEINHENMNQCIEDELKCTICQEIYINPTILNCSHTFCHHCIEVWIKNANQCPLCRKLITNKLYCRSLDTFLEKITQYLPEEVKSRRESLIVERNNNLADGFLMAGRDGGRLNNVVRPHRVQRRRYFDGQQERYERRI